MDISVEASLFQNYVFAHDQTVSCHLLQGWQDAVHVLIRIDENDDHGKLSSSVYKMTGLNPVSPEKPCVPFPAMVVMMPVGETMRIRWLPVSAI